ncbi:MAG: hypothetical protein J6T10_00875 [Methanobrevibacter sp.]|nr:hypothetical protein [Methanobrevibacter sp.]
MIVLHCVNLKNGKPFDIECEYLVNARNYLLKIVKGGYNNMYVSSFDCDYPYEYKELIYWYYRQPNNNNKEDK